MNPMRAKENAARRGEHALSTNGAEIVSKRYPNLSRSRFPSINVLGTSIGDLIQPSPDEKWHFGVRLNGADHQWGKNPPKEVVG